MDRARFDGRAPGVVPQTILIAQNVAWRVAQPYEVELNVLLSGLNLDCRDIRYARFRNRHGTAADRKAGDPHWRRIAGRAIPRDEAREPVIGSEPDGASTVAIRRDDLSRSEAIGGSVVAEVGQIRIETVYSASGSDVD